MSKSKQCHYCQDEISVKDLKVVRIKEKRVYVCINCLVKCNSASIRADLRHKINK